MFALIGYGLLGLVVAVGVVSLLVLVLPADHLGPAPRDVVPSGLPARPEIRGEDVARVRLPVTLRGYRMVDTDAILDRLAFELERRDQEIDNLRQRAGLPPRDEIGSLDSGSSSARLDERGADEVLVPVGATVAADSAQAAGSAAPGSSSAGPAASGPDNASVATAAPSGEPTHVPNDPTRGATALDGLTGSGGSTALGGSAALGGSMASGGSTDAVPQ